MILFVDFEDPVTRAPFAVADEDLNILTNDERLAVGSSTFTCLNNVVDLFLPIFQIQ